MSDVQPADSGRKFSLIRLLLLLIPVGLAAWGLKVYSNTLAPMAQAELEKSSIKALLGEQRDSVTLDGAYVDADGDMIADLPADEDQWNNPGELVFSYISSPNPEPLEETWKEFSNALSANTGLPVRLVAYANVADQTRALRDGDLHVTGFGTGDVEGAVNQAGFVPVVSFANAANQYRYKMEIIVPAKSKIETVEDLRGKTLIFTTPRSNSGCIAPVVILEKDFNLQPEKDYNWGLSLSHENSIRGVANEKFMAAAIASDILALLIETKEVTADQLHTIYSSEEFPPAAVGYAYNLNPKISDEIVKTMTGFAWSGTGLETAYGPAGAKQFAKVDYKTDWQPVRKLKIDAMDVVSKSGSLDVQ